MSFIFRTEHESTAYSPAEAAGLIGKIVTISDKEYAVTGILQAAQASESRLRFFFSGDASQVIEGKFSITLHTQSK
jgi:hypothetical protein